MIYHRSFIFSVPLEYLFIVSGVQSDTSDIEVTAKFAEDLGDSVKLKEKFLMELIIATQKLIKEKRSDYNPEKMGAMRQETEDEEAVIANELLPLNEDKPLINLLDVTQLLNPE